MNNRIVVSFDKSQEDIPTLVVGREIPSFLSYENTFVVDRVITGEMAEKLWKELKGE